MDDELTLPAIAEPKPSKNVSDAASELCEFLMLYLKAATHHILYLRGIYPQKYFRRERIFGTYTQACRHPAVTSYVSEVVDSLEDALRSGVLTAYCVSLHREGCRPHEALCFRPRLAVAHAAAPDVPWNHVDEALRGSLLRLHHCHYALPPARADCLFQVLVHTRLPGALSQEVWASDESPLPNPGRSSPPATASHGSGRFAAAAAAAAEASQNSGALGPRCERVHGSQSSGREGRHDDAGADTAAAPGIASASAPGVCGARVICPEGAVQDCQTAGACEEPGSAVDRQVPAGETEQQGFEFFDWLKPGGAQQQGVGETGVGQSGSGHVYGQRSASHEPFFGDMMLRHLFSSTVAGVLDLHVEAYFQVQ